MKLTISHILALVTTALYAVLILYSVVMNAIGRECPLELVHAVGIPFGVVITGYFGKSTVENVNKIKNENKDIEHNQI